MREIKFNVHDNGKIYNVRAIVWYAGQIANIEIFDPEAPGGTRLICGNADNLMQYIGLKDSAGVEIYENDIVKLINTIYTDCTRTEIEKVTEFTGIVQMWQNCWCLIRPTANKGRKIQSLFCYNLKDSPEQPDSGTFEKLGNVYDNPELLEEGKGC